MPRLPHGVAQGAIPDLGEDFARPFRQCSRMIVEQARDPVICDPADNSGLGAVEPPLSRPCDVLLSQGCREETIDFRPRRISSSPNRGGKPGFRRYRGLHRSRHTDDCRCGEHLDCPIESQAPGRRASQSAFAVPFSAWRPSKIDILSPFRHWPDPSSSNADGATQLDLDPKAVRCAQTSLNTILMLQWSHR